VHAELVRQGWNMKQKHVLRLMDNENLPLLFASYFVNSNSPCSLAVESPPSHTSNCSGSTTHCFSIGL
jgi:hypothetical protein